VIGNLGGRVESSHGHGVVDLAVVGTLVVVNVKDGTDTGLGKSADVNTVGEGQRKTGIHGLALGKVLLDVKGGTDEELAAADSEAGVTD